MRETGTTNGIGHLLRLGSMVTLAILLIPRGAAAGVSEDISALQPGEWYEIPNSRLSDAGVYPDPSPPGSTASVITAWSGAVYDTKRDNLLIWGGGHGDYAGNEIYAFDMSETFSWSRMWGPTAVAEIPTDGCHQAYPDGNPSSRHTYNHMAYMLEPYDAIYNHGGSYWKAGQPPPYVATWHFDLTTQVWQDKDEIDGFPGSGSAAYDPVSGLVFARSRFGMFEYDPAQVTWTKRAHDGAGLDSFPTGDIDPVARKMALIGSGGLHVFDLDTYAYADYTAADLTGDTEILDGTSPGFVFDSAIGAFVGWEGRAAVGVRPEDVYVIDPVALTVERRVPAATNTIVPTEASDRGTYGRWRYVPSRNVFVLVNGASDSVFVYRLSNEVSGPVCGDGRCDPGEDGASCCNDCGASASSVCCDNRPLSGDCCQDSECDAGQACDPSSNTCADAGGTSGGDGSDDTTNAGDTTHAGDTASAGDGGTGGDGANQGDGSDGGCQCRGAPGGGQLAVWWIFALAMTRRRTQSPTS